MLCLSTSLKSVPLEGRFKLLQIFDASAYLPFQVQRRTNEGSRDLQLDLGRHWIKAASFETPFCQIYYISLTSQRGKGRTDRLYDFLFRPNAILCGMEIGSNFRGKDEGEILGNKAKVHGILFTSCLRHFLKKDEIPQRSYYFLN